MLVVGLYCNQADAAVNVYTIDPALSTLTQGGLMGPVAGSLFEVLVPQETGSLMAEYTGTITAEVTGSTIETETIVLVTPELVAGMRSCRAVKAASSAKTGAATEPPP